MVDARLPRVAFFANRTIAAGEDRFNFSAIMTSIVSANMTYYYCLVMLGHPCLQFTQSHAVCHFLAPTAYTFCWPRWTWQFPKTNLVWRAGDVRPGWWILQSRRFNWCSWSMFGQWPCCHQKSFNRFRNSVLCALIMFLCIVWSKVCHDSLMCTYMFLSELLYTVSVWSNHMCLHAWDIEPMFMYFYVPMKRSVVYCDAVKCHVMWCNVM